MKVVLFILFSFTLYAASFNCQKASTKIEKMICQDKELSQLDTKLAKEYKKILQLSKQNAISQYEANSIYHFFKQSQKKWLKQRNSSCSHTPMIKECLKSYYQSRIKKLRSFTEDNSFTYRSFGNVLYRYTHKPFLYKQFKKELSKEQFEKIAPELLNWERFYNVCKDKFGVIDEACAKKIAKEKTAYYKKLLIYFKNNKTINDIKLERTSFSYQKDETCHIYNIYPKTELQKLFKAPLVLDSVTIPKIKDPKHCDEDSTPYREVINETITYINPNVVVLLRETYDYTGGAHGDYNSNHYTLDRNTAKEITWYDLFGKKKNVFFKYIVHNMKNLVAFEEYTTLSDQELYDLARNWYISPKGIVFKFSLYEIAPYADGEPSFVIPLNLIKQNISKEKFEYYFAK